MDAEKEEAEVCDGGDALPWVVAIEKPEYGDDPWFRMFCRAVAEAALSRTTKHEQHEQRED